jgi:hypothetical protein
LAKSARVEAVTVSVSPSCAQRLHLIEKLPGGLKRVLSAVRFGFESSQVGLILLGRAQTGARGQ